MASRAAQVSKPQPAPKAAAAFGEAQQHIILVSLISVNIMAICITFGTHGMFELSRVSAVQTPPWLEPPPGVYLVDFIRPIYIASTNPFLRVHGDA